MLSCCFPLCLLPYSWWFECDRKKADRLLAMPGNGEGTFLVRKSSGEIFSQNFGRKTTATLIRTSVLPLYYFSYHATSL